MTQRIAGEPIPPWFRFLPTDFVVWVALQAGHLRFWEADDPTSFALQGELLTTIVPYARRRAGKESDWAQDAVIPVWPLHEIGCPTLTLHGTMDAVVPFSHAEDAHARIPGSRLVRLDGDHLAPVRRHRETTAAIMEFLTEHPLGSE